MAGVFAQQRHDAELVRGQPHILPGQIDPAFAVIDQQVAHLIGALQGDGIVFQRRAGVAQGGADAGQQFDGSEGLLQIIVRAQIQRVCLILLHAAGRDHDDGRFGPGAYPADDLRAVQIRQAQIQQNAVRAVGGDHFQRLDARVRP